MVQDKGGLVGRQLEVLWTTGTLTGLSDAQLLSRFTSVRDATAESAFRELVNRHGPMVMGVCRQILRRVQDAEDAFQATFLVLVRKARAVRVNESLAPWLYSVALRTAQRARAAGSRYRQGEDEELEALAAATEDVSHVELRPLLHEELGRLPDKYRTPIVLCHLEGKTHEEAARMLHWPVGTVSGRLSRGRELLKSRLERRGLANPSAIFGASGWNMTQSIPSSLVESTLTAATRFATAQSVSSSVLSLTHGVLRAMLLRKLKIASLALLAVGGVSGGAVLWARSSTQSPQPAVADAPKNSTVKPEPGQRYRGIVREWDGTPIAGVAITGTRDSEIDFDNGVLRHVPRDDRPFLTTDQGGQYQFNGPAGRFGVFAYHEKGYARKSADELAASADLTLEPWAQVKGVVTVMGKPLANVPVRFTLDATDQHSMFYDYYEYDARTDDQGRFSVEHVPAGVAHASTGNRFGKDGGPYGIVSSANSPILPGEILNLNIGGAGRPVVGKIRAVAGIPVNLGGGVLTLKTSDKLKPKAERTAKEMETWDREKRFLYYFDDYRSREGLARRLAERSYSVQINSDGTFRAVEVLPGRYTLSFWFGEDFQHPRSFGEVTIHPGSARRTHEPLHIGMVVIKAPEMTSAPGAAGRSQPGSPPPAPAIPGPTH